MAPEADDRHLALYKGRITAGSCKYLRVIYFAAAGGACVTQLVAVARRTRTGSRRSETLVGIDCFSICIKVSINFLIPQKFQEGERRLLYAPKM